MNLREALVDVQPLIDYLNDPNHDEEIVKAMNNAYLKSVLKSPTVTSFIADSGLTTGIFKKVAADLSEDDYEIVITMMANIHKFQDFDLMQPISDYLSNYIFSITGKAMSDTGIKSLINSSDKSGQISTGPAENVVALLFSNTTKMGKGDISIGGVPTEFKFGGGRVATTSCECTIAEVWRQISQELNIDAIDWPDNGKGNTIVDDAKMSKHDAAISKWFKQVNDYDAFAAATVNAVKAMFKGCNLNGYVASIKKLLPRTKIGNTGEVITKILGCLCIAAYKEVEKFEQMLIQSKDSRSGKYTKVTLLQKFDLPSLYASNIKFSRPNTADGFKGMVINVA